MGKSKRSLDLETFRKNNYLITEKASEEDINNYVLCRWTNRSRADLIHEIAKVSGHRTKFVTNLGYSPGSMYKITRKLDSGYWGLLCDWMWSYIPQYEDYLKKVVQEMSGFDLSLPSSQEILENVAKALDIDVQELAHIIESQPDLDLFFKKSRGLLGTIAETNLWKQAAQGRHTTWLLERLLPDIYGQKGIIRAPESDKVIRIIEEQGTTGKEWTD